MDFELFPPGSLCINIYMCIYIYIYIYIYICIISQLVIISTGTMLLYWFLYWSKISYFFHKCCVFETDYNSVICTIYLVKLFCKVSHPYCEGKFNLLSKLLYHLWQDITTGDVRSVLAIYIIRMKKSRGMRWAEYVERLGKEGKHIQYFEKTWGKETAWQTQANLEDNIKTDFNVSGFEYLELFLPA